MLLADLHTHTVNSGDGLNTLYEMAQEAGRKGLKILGCVSHGPSFNSSYPHDAYCVFERVNKELFGVRILMGIEMNIIDESGRIDVKENSHKFIMAKLAGLHEDLGSIEKNTNAIFNAIANPNVHIITHPYCYFKTDIEKIALAAVKYNKLLELNNSTFKYNMERIPWQLDSARKMVAVLKKHNHKLIINSDAHVASDLGEDMAVLSYKKELGLADEMIINSDLITLKKFLKID
ncbi:MAG: PHP domain-containing protein [archaeon]